jgi:MFS family permease
VSDRGGALAAFGFVSFRRYQLARLASTLSTQMASVAIGWQVYATTHRALDLGYIGLAQFLPAIVLALPAGAVADRFDRRAIVVASHATVALGWATLYLLARNGVASVAPIYAVLALLGVARAFAGPASQALLPNLVPDEVLGSAVSWSSTVWQVATIAGPSLGGLLYGVGGAPVVYLVALAGSAAAATLVAGVRPLPSTRPASPRARSWDELLAGVRYVWNNRLVLGLISLDLFAVLLGGAVAMMPVFAHDILHARATSLGLLRSAPAVGATLMAVWLAYRPLVRRAGFWMLVSVAIFGAATVAFAYSRALWLSIVMLVVIGASDMVSVVVRQHAVQLATPDAMRGRVGAVNQVFVGASNELGEFESGVVAAGLGPVRAVALGGVGTLLVVALWAWLFPTLRRLDRMERSTES